MASLSQSIEIAIYHIKKSLISHDNKTNITSSHPVKQYTVGGSIILRETKTSKNRRSKKNGVHVSNQIWTTRQYINLKFWYGTYTSVPWHTYMSLYNRNFRSTLYTFIRMSLINQNSRQRYIYVWALSKTLSLVPIACVKKLLLRPNSSTLLAVPLY